MLKALLKQILHKFRDFIFFKEFRPYIFSILLKSSHRVYRFNNAYNPSILLISLFPLLNKLIPSFRIFKFAKCSRFYIFFSLLPSRFNFSILGVRSSHCIWFILFSSKLKNLRLAKGIWFKGGKAVIFFFSKFLNEIT